MKRKMFLGVALFLAISMANLFGQVRIGDNADPHPGAILDLTNASNLGMLLPRMSLDDVGKWTHNGGQPLGGDKLQAMGMTVYNTNKCAIEGAGVYVWDGNRWTDISAKGKEIPAPACNQSGISGVVFAPYNLGANVAKIDGIAVAENISKTKAYIKCSVDDFDAVLGDYYQWGRIADGHQKYDSPAVYVGGATYDANGQVSDPTHAGRFIYADDPAPTEHDWASQNTVHNHNLWGNGVTVEVPTPQGAQRADGAYFQSTEWKIPSNNPCPSGFRVPTQDEWERIGEYDCNPSVAGGHTGMYSVANSMSNTTGLTWVRVINGKAASTHFADGDKSGWAIYKTADWNAAGTNYRNGTDYLYASAAPEPLLFLPAVGYRDTRSNIGRLTTTSTNGYYWSSSASIPGLTWGSGCAYGVGFSSYEVYLNGSTFYRANGFSVRCVAK